MGETKVSQKYQSLFIHIDTNNFFRYKCSTYYRVDKMKGNMNQIFSQLNLIIFHILKSRNMFVNSNLGLKRVDLKVLYVKRSTTHNGWSKNAHCAHFSILEAPIAWTLLFRVMGSLIYGTYKNINLEKKIIATDVKKLIWNIILWY